MARAPLLLLALLSGLLAGPTCASRPYVPLLDAFDCPLMPDDSYWHADVSALPVHPRSEAWVHSIGLDAPVHPDFGSSPRFGGLSLGGPVGIPYVTVGQRQPRVPVSFDFAAESDPGPYPIPADAPIEGGTDSLGDRHVLVVDGRACILYELFDAIPEADGSWSAGSGAIFRLGTNELRPEGWTSADAAGLPILPGLVRFEEAALGLVGHALRFTAPRTQSAALWPARHFASADADPDLPPMGAWFRLRAEVDPARFSPLVRPIVEALKRHGMILADNGSPWSLSGAPSDHWDDAVLRELRGLSGADFEAIDASSLIVDRGSGRAAGP